MLHLSLPLWCSYDSHAILFNGFTGRAIGPNCGTAFYSYGVVGTSSFLVSNSRHHCSWINSRILEPSVISRCLLDIRLCCTLWTGSVLFGSIHPDKLTSSEKVARMWTLLQLSSTLIASKTLYTWQLIFLQHHFHKAFICVCFKNQIFLWFLKVIICTLSDYVENNIGLEPGRRQRILNYFARVIRIKTL